MTKEYLSQRQIEKWKALPDSDIISAKGLVYPWVDIHKNVELWLKFWVKTYQGVKSDYVLDFGCGVGWGWFVGRVFGFDHIIPFDIESKEMKSIFSSCINILKTPVIYWKGYIIPFGTNKFDSVVAKTSILKCKDTNFDILIRELCRITKPEGLWYIAPKYHYSRLKKKLKEASLEHLLLEKKIKLKYWIFDKGVEICLR